MTLAYRFEEQKAMGQQGEDVLDEHFSRWFDVVAATEREQRMGIDRLFYGRDDGSCRRVEYKTDHKAFRTGNAFVETISVENASTLKAGWAYTSRADWLMYYLPEGGLVYVLRMADLRRELPRWERRYSRRTIPNEGYVTKGLLVPLAEFEAHAFRVVEL